MIQTQANCQTKCPICGASASQLLSLPKYPVTEFYEPWSEVFVLTGYFDQIVRFCSKCTHLFLERVIDTKFTYSNYKTTSGSSPGALKCLDNLEKFARKHLEDLDSVPTIIDIGGNDGSLLSKFKSKGKKLINIDPNASGPDEIEKLKVFFQEINLAQFRTRQRKVIFCSHTIEHIEDPMQFIREIGNSLNYEDVLFLQFPSLESLIRYFRFDQVCHQHINYFSLNSISILLLSMGLGIQHYEFDEEHYGTLRLMVRRELKKREIETLHYPVNAHHVLQAYETFRNFCTALDLAIRPMFETGGAGFGAGLMVPTLAYNVPTVSKLSVIYDDNQEKIDHRFINLNARILSPNDSFFSSPIIITSISTKSAGRSIYHKLANAGVEYIVLPVIYS